MLATILTMRGKPARHRTGLVALAGAAVAIFAAIGGAHAADRIRVGEGPFITGGAFYVARDKGYFRKLGLEIETKSFIDGAMAVPAIIAGDLDLTLMTANASLFNSIAKGAPLVLILDRGNNRKGFAYTLANVREALHEQGIKSMGDFAKLKGKRIGVGALGSINQYNMAQALLKVGLDPAKDVQWVVNVSQPDLMKMLGQGQVDATDLAWQFGVFAQENKWGPIVATGDQMVPDSAIAMVAASKDFLDKHRDAAVRFAMAYLHAAKEFNAAAVAPDQHPDVVEILAKNTALNKPELVKKIAPHWSYVNEDGMPLVDSIMAMQDFWSGKYFNYVEKKVSREQLFDLTIARDAKARRDKEKPFGN
jgi:NitT/TauT family transport system substrate-binding protein